MRWEGGASRRLTFPIVAQAGGLRSRRLTFPRVVFLVAGAAYA